MLQKYSNKLQPAFAGSKIYFCESKSSCIKVDKNMHLLNKLVVLAYLSFLRA